MLLCGECFIKSCGKDFQKIVEKKLNNKKNCSLSICSFIYNKIRCGEIRFSPLELFLRKGVLKICSKLTGERPCLSAISIKLQRNFIEIILRHGYSSVNLLHIFTTPFLKNPSGRLILLIVQKLS